MATYTGFSTINADTPDQDQLGVGYFNGTQLPVPQQTNTRKFRLSDRELIIRDYLNAINIPQGAIPGKPHYGTTLWGYIFDQNTPQTQSLIEEELYRLAAMDPRFEVNIMNSSLVDNGLIINIEIATIPNNEVSTLAVMFDQSSSKATISG